MMSLPSTVTPAFGGVDDAADDVDQRGLSSPVGTQQGEDFALADLQIDILEGPKPAVVGLGEPLDGYDGLLVHTAAGGSIARIRGPVP